MMDGAVPANPAMYPGNRAGEGGGGGDGSVTFQMSGGISDSGKHSNSVTFSPSVIACMCGGSGSYDWSGSPIQPTIDHRPPDADPASQRYPKVVSITQHHTHKKMHFFIARSPLILIIQKADKTIHSIAEHCPLET